MKKYLLGLCACFLHMVLSAQLPASFAIPISVTNTAAPAHSIKLSWPANTFATSYTIKRKQVDDSSYLRPFETEAAITTDAASANSYTDVNTIPGVLYEYEISATYSVEPLERTMYVCAGTAIKPIHQRGTIILLCEENLANAIEAKMRLLYQDLVGDGWGVVQLAVPHSDNPADAKGVRQKIITAYNTYPNVKQVLIIGHAAVPYAGNFSPDGHTNHIGCWPADGYYGSLGGNWTDTITSYSVSTTRPANINLPLDGKFDQNDLPRVQLAVGRVDFSNLPVFSSTEEDLTAAYIDKNHQFRHGQIQLKKQALVEDNFLSFTEKFSQSAWKSFGALTGFDNVVPGQYETDLLSADGYLWSYGAGGGNYTGASGIGNSSYFATNAYKTIFTQLFGSYFGDWDTQDNYMRSALASPGNTLTCVWGGRPHWYFHHMAAGLPIGYAELLSMNNRGLYSNTGYSSAQVHMALMGDPTLRSSYIKPPQAFFAQAHSSLPKVNLLWTPAAETGVTGYHIYRSNSLAGEFVQLTDTPVTLLRFTDSTPLNGRNVYMIRTAKADTMVTTGNFTNNSSFMNLSQGLFDSVSVVVTTTPPPVISLELLAPADSAKQVVITGNNNNKRYFVGQKNGQVKLYNSNFSSSAVYLTVPVINEGLFSFVFDPDFNNNKLLYVFHTNLNGDLELSRFKEAGDGDTAVFDGTLFTIPDPGASRNLGGEMHFDANRYLYISTGDGDTRDAAAGNAQNTGSLLGKILRIIPPPTSETPASAYTIPTDNPYNNEVYALGLRFPYRWSIDGELKNAWIGERGDSSVEEINLLSLAALNGANFGWPCYDGISSVNNNGCGSPSDYTYPVYHYNSPGAGSSVTGGVRYRGETYISLQGYYVFADAKDSNVYLLRFDSVLQAYKTVSQLLLPGAISDISEDNDGELYATSLTGGIYRIAVNGPRLYRFFGTGNWTDPANWSNKTVPPAILPAGSQIVIGPAENGECILTIPQTILPGAKISVENGGRFRITGNLTLQ